MLLLTMSAKGTGAVTVIRKIAFLEDYCWEKHNCGLYQLPAAA